MHLQQLLVDNYPGYIMMLMVFSTQLVVVVVEIGQFQVGNEMLNEKCCKMWQ